MIGTPGTPTTGANEFDIVSTRLFAAPRELVFQAFSDPNHLVD